MGKIKLTFYDWCINNNRTDLLELWDYEKNIKTPEQIGSNTGTRIWFKCPRGIHESEQHVIATLTSNRPHIGFCKKCGSFGQWCKDNNEGELLERWDYELNEVDPFMIPVTSHKKIYLKCPRNLHPSESVILSNIIYFEGSRRCKMCNSFGQWATDNIGDIFWERYWSDKNTVDPYSISFCSDANILINCQDVDYHGAYQLKAHEFHRGYRCPYCHSSRVHLYDSLGYRYPETLSLWSEKNEKSPYEYTPYSNKEVFFNCDIHGEYKQTIYSFVRGECECKYCRREMHQSRLQTKVQNYLSELGYKVLHEADCHLSPINPRTNKRLYYDNEVTELKLFIEVNGDAHYKICFYHYSNAKRKKITPEESLEDLQYRDSFKKDYVISNGYHYLAIPYWEDQSYKKLIDEKIEEILLNSNR